MLRYLRETGHSGELIGLTLSKEQLTYDLQQVGLSISLLISSVSHLKVLHMIVSIPLAR